MLNLSNQNRVDLLQLTDAGGNKPQATLGMHKPNIDLWSMSWQRSLNRRMAVHIIACCIPLYLPTQLCLHEIYKLELAPSNIQHTIHMSALAKQVKLVTSGLSNFFSPLLTSLYWMETASVLRILHSYLCCLVPRHLLSVVVLHWDILCLTWFTKPTACFRGCWLASDIPAAPTVTSGAWRRGWHLTLEHCVV